MPFVLCYKRKNIRGYEKYLPHEHAVSFHLDDAKLFDERDQAVSAIADAPKLNSYEDPVPVEVEFVMEPRVRIVY